MRTIDEYALAMTSRAIFNISKHNELKTVFLEMRLARPDFEVAVVTLRNKWGIDVDWMTDGSEESDKKWISYQEDTAFCDDVEKMLVGLGLSVSWEEIAILYVIDGGESETDSIHKDSDGLILEIDTENVDDAVIRVGPHATFEDLKEAWDKLRELRGTRTRKKVRGNSSRDLKVFMLHQRGYTVAQICKEIDEEYPPNNADGMSETYVRKIISEVYERHGVPPSERLKLKTK